MPTEIFLIRHGETAWNAVRRLQGHIDIALNEAGLRQADALAQALAATPLAAVVASDLQRAQQTAEAVAGRHGLPVHADPALRERCYGAFEGLLYTEIEAAYPADFAAWQARAIDARMPDGERAAESFRQFYARGTAAIAHWAARYPDQRIAIVAHGGVLECAYRAATGMALDRPRDFQIKNASLNRFVWDGERLVLEQWGDTAHLAALALDDVI